MEYTSLIRIHMFVPLLPRKGPGADSSLQPDSEAGDSVLAQEKYLDTTQLELSRPRAVPTSR